MPFVKIQDLIGFAYDHNASKDICRLTLIYYAMSNFVKIQDLIGSSL